MDIHTHIRRPGAVYNLTLEELRQEPLADTNEWLSAGLHPWYLTTDWKQDLMQLRKWAALPQVVAIGEAGLDRLVTTSCQEEAFRAQIQLSEEIYKPLIIHCVKATDKLLALHKKLCPTQRWIFHGFRGGPALAQQLLNTGFYLSFGEHFNESSLLLCPPFKRYTESDESSLSFIEICKRQQVILDHWK